MTDILQDIIAHKREELQALTAPKPSLRQALLHSQTGIIAEFKRRSPSKGWIKEEGRAEEIPLSYQQHGAAALSILTDKHYFGGHDDFIRAARRTGVTIPILYKNFVIDEAQLYAALYAGASAVLLIAACLTKQRCAELMARAHSLGLEVLLEMHDEQELEYAELRPDLCGINNRHLGSFTTDVQTSFRLAERLRASCAAPRAKYPERLRASCAAPRAESPERSRAECPERSRPVCCDSIATPDESGSHQPPLLVSESGISDPAIISDLRQAGFSGFLIGETFMRQPDPGAALGAFIHQISRKP